MRSHVRLETWNRVSTWISRYQRRDLCGIRRKREDSIPCSSHKYTREELNRYRRSFCRIQCRMAQSVRGVSSRFGSKMRPDGRILFSQRPEFLISRTICRCSVNIHLIARTHVHIRIEPPKDSPPVRDIPLPPITRLFPRADLDIDIDSRVTWTARGYHMTRWSLCVLSTTVYSPGLPLYTANLISPISTALRRPHDAIYTGRPAPSPPILPTTHTYTRGGLPSSL